MRLTLIIIILYLGLFSCSYPYTPWSGGQSSSAGGFTAQPNQVGMNVWFLSDWDGSKAFADAMKHARPFVNPGWDGPVSLDSEGWPQEDASTVIFANYDAADNGLYRLVFEGQADVSALWLDNCVFSNKTYDTDRNITACDAYLDFSTAGTGGLVFRNTRRTALSATNTGIRYIRLYRPGYSADGSTVFTREFLSALQGAGVIRTMDWTGMNNNGVRTWAERTTPYYAGVYSGTFHVNLSALPQPEILSNLGGGMAIEHLVELCNESGADLWINVPVLADDTYVDNMARVILYGSDGTNPYSSYVPDPVFPPLSNDLKVYLEYGNEIWNGAPGFNCMAMVRDLVWKTTAAHPIRCDGWGLADHEWQLVWRYPAWRLAEISLRLRSIFGDAAMMTRVRPVLMTQLGDGQMSLSIALSWADDYYRVRTGTAGLKELYWGAGGSAYYDVNEPLGYTGGFLGGGNYPSSNFMRNNTTDSIWAYNYGLKRVAYEGGAGLDIRTNGELIFSESEMLALNADLRMRYLVEDTHTAWSRTGGDLLVYYCLRGPAAWEFTPDIRNTSSPKLTAFRNISAGNRARVTVGASLPGTAVVLDHTYIRTGYDYLTVIDSKNCVAGNDAGEFLAIGAHADSAFTGRLAVNGRSSPEGVTMAVWINGVNAGTVSLSNTGTGIEQSSPVLVMVPEGLVVVRVEVLSGMATLYSVTVTNL